MEKKNYVGSSPTISILLYVAPAVEHVLSVAFEKKYGVSRPINGIFVYVAQAVERVLAVAFGTHNTHKRQTSILPVGCEPTISADEGP